MTRPWLEVVPPSVQVSAGPLHDAPALSTCERTSAGDVDACRLRELENGRAYAKRALAMLGVRDAELPIGRDGAPVWPEGIVGSITHASMADGVHFAAAVARRADVLALGIDMEADSGLAPDLWAFALSEREQRRLLAALPARARGAEAKALWCAKEAVAKAARLPFEPAAMEVECSGRRFVARHDSREWRGRMCTIAGAIRAAVVVPSSVGD